MIYLWLALGATTIGSMAGIGGGVILKPILDFMGEYDVQTISFLSSMTIFSMAVVSSIKYSRSKVSINFKQSSIIGVGAVGGGIIGERLLRILISYIEQEQIILMQNIILVMLMIMTFYYMNNRKKFKSYKIENPCGWLIIGFGLGTMSSILSIGGGPINVCVLAIAFSMKTKEAAITSVIIILFSQISKLLTVTLTGNIPSLDYKVLVFMIIGGILGGFIGSSLNKNLKESNIQLVFNGTLVLLICINLVNVYNGMPLVNGSF